MYGKRIYGTTEAFEGYRNLEEADCVRCDTAEQFIQALQTVNETNCPAFCPGSREYFLNYYCTDRIKGDYIRFLASL